MNESTLSLFDTTGRLDMYSPTGLALTIVREFRRVRRELLRSGAIPEDAYALIASEGVQSRHNEVLDTLMHPEIAVWDRDTLKEAERYLSRAVESLQESLIAETANALLEGGRKVSPLGYIKVFVTYLEIIAQYEDGLYEYVGMTEPHDDTTNPSTP